MSLSDFPTSQSGASVQAYGARAAEALAATQSAGGLATRDARPIADAKTLRVLRPVADLEAEAVAFAHTIGGVPYTRQTRARFFAEVRARLHQAGANEVQLTVVDLVASMFDIELDDRTIPEHARPLVWRLQQPVLLLALMDPAYLGREGQSMRAMLETLGQIADGFGEQWTPDSELGAQLTTSVRALEIVAANLYGRMRALSTQVEREQARAADGIRRVVSRMLRQRRALEATPQQRNRRDYARRPGRDEERAMTHHIEAQIDQRLEGRPVPDTVDEYLRSVWVRVLRTVALRDGEQSDSYHRALHVVDDLLATVDGPDGQGARTQLAGQIPGLIETLHDGMRQIGVSPQSHQDFFDELFLLHLRRLQGGKTRVLSKVPPATAAVKPAPALRGATYYDIDAVPVLAQRLPTSTHDKTAPDKTMDDGARPDMFRDDHSRDHDDVSPQIQPATVDEARVDVTGPIERADEMQPATAAANASDMQATTDEEASTTGAVNEQALSAVTAEAARYASDPTSERLLALVESADLSDLPKTSMYSNARASQQFSQLSTGQWLEYRSKRQRAMRLKVVWINDRRTIVVFVRAPDRLAVSRPMNELADLFRRGKLRRIDAVSLAPGPERSALAE